MRMRNKIRQKDISAIGSYNNYFEEYKVWKTKGVFINLQHILNIYLYDWTNNSSNTFFNLLSHIIIFLELFGLIWRPCGAKTLCSVSFINTSLLEYLLTEK